MSETLPKTTALDIIKAGNGELTTSAALYGAEIDSQISTAKAYPRSMTGFTSGLRALVTTSVEIAESCEYAVPRDGKTITGPSARFAELLAYSYGNCRVAGRIIEIDKKHVTAQGVFHDLENNSMKQTEVKRRITYRDGRTYSDDMIATTCQAAIAIATRNAIIAGVPRALWETIFDDAKRAAEGTKESLPKRVELLMKAFETDFGVAPQRVLLRAGYEEADQFTPKKLAFFRSLYVALKDGDMSLDEVFPRESGPRKAPTLDDLATSSAVDRPYTPPAPPSVPDTVTDTVSLVEEPTAATEPAHQANQVQDQPTQPGTPPAFLDGPELQAALKKLANRISRTIKPAALDDIEAEIIAELRIPNSDAEDLLDLLANRRAELS